MCLAVPGKVLDIWEKDGTPMASVDFGGVVKEVCLEYVPDLQVGEYAIVHVGFALQRLDEESALETLELFASSASWRRSSATSGDGRPTQAGLPARTAPTTPQEATPMKYLDEFSDPELARRLLDDIHATVTQPWAMMEVCGGQTHTIIRHGIDQLLPDGVELIHGPGCPVCVTPLEMIDKALEIASRPERDLLLLRRHAPGARHRAATCSGSRATAATSGSSTRRWTPSRSPSRTRTGRWCSSASASRPPPRPTR